MSHKDDVVYMRKRIKDLEEKVDQLRLGRRVLMNLIEKLEKDKLSLQSQMAKENKKLLNANYRYARWLLCKNRQIVELESKLQQVNH